MEFLSDLSFFVFHVDTYLGEVISRYGAASYAFLFAIIFAETGFVITPFLPGDSLLFAAGAFAALGSFNIFLLATLLWVAAFLGDIINYWIGYLFGEKILANPKMPINPKYIEKTKTFYSRYGKKTIVLARFVPIVRTFAPFIAGIGEMKYTTFMLYNAVGGFIWVFGFTFIGYFLGNTPFIKDNFSIVVLFIIVISVVPIITGIIKTRVSKD